MTIVDLEAYFYANDSLVASTQPESLNRAFDVLTGLFDRVGLQTNTAKTVAMVFHPCHAPGGMSEAAYVRQVTGKGPKFRECQQMRVECTECGVEVTAGLLLTHRQSQNGVGRGDRGGHPPPPRESHTYQVSFPKHLSRLRCPVAGCLGGASSRTNLRIHFAHRHVRDTIAILEKVSRPYPRCPQCDMFVPQKALNFRHLTTALCRRLMERKWRRLAEEEAWDGTEGALTTYVFPLSQVPSFKYLGRVLAAEDDDWPKVVRNLRRARQKWARLTRVPIREGADARTLGHIYLAVVQ